MIFTPMFKHVNWYTVTNVLEDPAASTLMLPAVQEGWTSSTLKTEAAKPSEK
jgi:hypothetical protein